MSESLVGMKYPKTGASKKTSVSCQELSAPFDIDCLELLRHEPLWSVYSFAINIPCRNILALNQWFHILQEYQRKRQKYLCGQPSF